MQTKFKKKETMNIKLIKTEVDYQEALKRLEEIFDAKIGTAPGWVKRARSLSAGTFPTRSGARNRADAAFCP